jgi:8-hydroxy-5-deazaflavin:NADPH oxidoreductase
LVAGAAVDPLPGGLVAAARVTATEMATTAVPSLVTWASGSRVRLRLPGSTPSICHAQTRGGARKGEGTVRIAIIGTGKMGRGFAQALAPTHEVVIGSRDPNKAAATASKTGAAGGATYADAAANADVVILAVPWQAMDETLGQLGDLPGTIVIDVSYPYTKREREALKGSSTAEAIQKRLPSAKVFKGWNHVFARYLTDPVVDGIAASVLIAGDDPVAKDIVFAIARDIGFHPVDAGPLRATRDLEKLVGVMLFLRLGPFRVLSRP